MRWFNKLCIPIIILIVFVSAKNVQWGGDNWKGIIKADGKGYYAYLPALFIYNDLNFSFFESIEKNTQTHLFITITEQVVTAKLAINIFLEQRLQLALFF